jgi:hypothetical protein
MEVAVADDGCPSRQWEVNTGHRDFRSVVGRPALKLRLRVLWPLEEEIAGYFAQARVRPTGKPRLLLTRATIQREKR